MKTQDCVSIKRGWKSLEPCLRLGGGSHLNLAQNRRGMSPCCCAHSAATRHLEYWSGLRCLSAYGVALRGVAWRACEAPARKQAIKQASQGHDNDGDDCELRVVLATCADEWTLTSGGLHVACLLAHSESLTGCISLVIMSCCLLTPGRMTLSRASTSGPGWRGWDGGNLLLICSLGSLGS
jgi:hypothetical protein